VNQKTLNKVFISYSWKCENSKKLVRQLANSLNKHNTIECLIDEHIKYSFDWKLLIDKKMESSNFIIVVCNESYYNCFMKNENCEGKGVIWEAGNIRSLLDTEKASIVPIVFNSIDKQYIPISLHNLTQFDLSKQLFDSTCSEYKRLVETLMYSSSSVDKKLNKPSYIEENDNRYVLFNQKMFLDAKKLFKLAILNDPDDKKNVLYYIISTLANVKKINTLSEGVIEYLYNNLERLKDGEYSNIAVYLWCILYREFSEKYYFIGGLFFFFDSKWIISNILLRRENRRKQEVINILYEEIEYLLEQQRDYLKSINPDEIIQSFWRDMKEFESHYIETILKKENLSCDEFVDFYNEPRLSGIDLIFPIIPSWALLQESKQKVDNSTLMRKTGICLAYDKIENKVTSLRIDKNGNPFFRLWYIQFLLFNDKNLILITFYYDFVTKKPYSEHIELYQYNHITNYSYSNEDMTYMKDDFVIQESNLPKELQDKIFNNETKIISLESASGSHYRCVLPNEEIVDKFSTWLEYKKEQEDIEKQFEDLPQEEIDDVPNPYESELIEKLHENIDNQKSLTQSLAWKSFEELKRRVEKANEIIKEKIE